MTDSPRTPGRSRAPAFGVGESGGESTMPATPRAATSTARRFVRAGTDASRRLHKVLTGSRRGGGGDPAATGARRPPPPVPLHHPAAPAPAAAPPPGAAAAAAASSVGGELGARLARYARRAGAGLAGLSEKGVDGAARDLASLDAALGAELTRAAVDGHEAFVEAAAGVASLSTELDELRSLLADRAALEDELLSLARSAARGGGAVARADAASPLSSPLAPAPAAPAPLADLDWGDALDAVDEATAAGRLAAALTRLRAAERAAVAAGGGGAGGGGAARELAARRTALAAAADRQVDACVATAHGTAASAAGATGRWRATPLAPPFPDLKSAVAVLASLTGRPHAVSRLLAAHRAALDREWASALAPSVAAAAPPDPHGVALTAAIVTAAVVTVCAGAADVDGTAAGGGGGGDAPPSDAAATALLAAWADDVAAAAALLVKRHALAPLAAPAGPARVAAAVGAALAAAAPAASAAALDPRPRLALDLWPSLDQVLAASTDRAAARLRRAAAADAGRGGGLPPGTAAADPAALRARFPSAAALLADAADAAAALAPVAGPRAAAATAATAAALFGAWCDGAREAVAAAAAAPSPSVPAILDAARALATKHVPAVLAGAGARDGGGELAARWERLREEVGGGVR